MTDPEKTVVAAFAALDAVLQRLRERGPGDAAADLAAVQQAIADLNGAAERLRLPFGSVRQKTTALRHHLRVLLGAEPSDGHTRAQHIRWALGGLLVLRRLGFERVLEVANRGARGRMLH